MYQFYYSDYSQKVKKPEYRRNIKDEYIVTAVRPTMWEEHCLECSAPACFHHCVYFEARRDGRCKRFANGIYVYRNDRANASHAAHVVFRKWANMMTILFPAMLSPKEYRQMVKANDQTGKKLKKLVRSELPVLIRWEGIRSVEYLRRQKLRRTEGIDNVPDAFVFHGYSFSERTYRLLIEVYEDSISVYKTSLLIEPGENLFIIDRSEFTEACSKAGNLIKVYPENNFEAELDILWCDFVKGKPITKEKPAEKVKCVVWDLDLTVWDGILIETEDPASLKLNPGVLDLIKALDESGIVQSVASKNDYELAWPVLEQLGISDYFLYPQIQWNAKSSSLEQIAKSLNIGLDSLAIIDDSVFERNQVHQFCPQVRVYDVTELQKIISYPEFQVMVTSESKNRRLMYKAEEKRNQIMNSDNTDIITFLKKCNLQINIFEPKSEEEIQRCYELVVRTNQLNMSGRKYTQEEFLQVLSQKDHKNFAFSCKDDFGEYGIVGYGQYKVLNEKQLVMTEFAMSCRVAGKYVESSLFEALLNAEKCDFGVFDVRITKKNSLLRRTLESIGFSTRDKTESSITYTFRSPLLNDEIVRAKIV